MSLANNLYRYLFAQRLDECNNSHWAKLKANNNESIELTNIMRDINIEITD